MHISSRAQAPRLPVADLYPLEDLEAAFQIAAAEWRTIAPPGRPTTPVDESGFAAARAEASAIVAAGKWTSGPQDLLSVLGRQRDELFHSRILGWLLTPTGQHGLGHGFLAAFLQEIWPEDLPGLSGPVSVQLEVVRQGTDDDAHVMEARADLVLDLDGTVVVIENKVDAGEQPDQCERLYWAWANDPVETRWIFLSPTGREPTSATSPDARAAWATASYRDVFRALQTALSDKMNDGVGQASASQYLATLTALGVNN